MKKSITKKPIIIDTDPGHDDALAIMLLEKSNQIDVKAITTVCGNSTIENVTSNARFILDLIGSKTPIYSGAKKPLKRKLIQAVVHGKSGLAGADVSRKEKLTGNAVEKIIEIVRKNPKKVSIVMLGPQTNIAEAFLRDPELPRLIKKLVIMGGAIAVPGNKNRVAEFNIFVDPEAADIVFRAPVKKIIIPLDVCNEVYLNMRDFQKLKSAKAYPQIKSMMKEYIKGILTFEKEKKAFMYDPLAAYYLLNPRAFQTQNMDIAIETKGELTRGMTVAEKRKWGGIKNNVEVAASVDRNVFVADFLRIIGSDE
jgi:inosine-uridine nucleoside N-ribohydrolase